MMLLQWAFATVAILAGGASSQNPDSCSGYSVSNYKDNGKSLVADLTLKGSPCNIYGDDIKNLKLLVEYQSSELTFTPSGEPV